MTLTGIIVDWLLALMQMCDPEDLNAVTHVLAKTDFPKLPNWGTWLTFTHVVVCVFKHKSLCTLEFAFVYNGEHLSCLCAVVVLSLESGRYEYSQYSMSKMLLLLYVLDFVTLFLTAYLHWPVWLQARCSCPAKRPMASWGDTSVLTRAYLRSCCRATWKENAMRKRVTLRRPGRPLRIPI